MSKRAGAQYLFGFHEHRVSLILRSLSPILLLPAPPLSVHRGEVGMGLAVVYITSSFFRLPSLFPGVHWLQDAVTAPCHMAEIRELAANYSIHSPALTRYIKNQAPGSLRYLIPLLCVALLHQA